MSEPTTTAEPQAPQPGDPVVFIDREGVFRPARVIRIAHTGTNPHRPSVDLVRDDDSGQLLRRIEQGDEPGQWLRPLEADASPARRLAPQANTELPPSERRLGVGVFVIYYAKQERGLFTPETFITPQPARVRGFEGEPPRPSLAVFATTGSLTEPPDPKATAERVVSVRGHGPGEAGCWSWPDELVGERRVPRPADPSDFCTACKTALRGAGTPVYLGQLMMFPTPTPVARLCDNCSKAVRDLATGVGAAEVTA